MIKKPKLLKTPKHECNACGSPVFKVVGQHEVALNGLLGDQHYQSILYKRVECQACKQHGMMKEYVAAEPAAAVVDVTDEI